MILVATKNFTFFFSNYHDKAIVVCDASNPKMQVLSLCNDMTAM